jgi:DNA-binding response OmpR family regulator
MKKILVCDDDRSILEVIKIILEENGFGVLTLQTGKGILKKVKDYRPDLILLDIWMPGIDGKEITKLFKKDKDTKDIPIIIISALNETQKLSKNIGADGFLSKPFEMTDLLDIANKFTNN